MTIPRLPVRSIAVLALAALLPAAALAGPPFRTDDPETVDYRHWEIDMFSQGTAISGATTAELPAYEINYGALPNLQLHTILPLGYQSQAGGQSGFAPGDIELGFKYRFVAPREGDWFPQVAVFPTVELPTGNQKLGGGTGHAQYYLPIWLQKSFGVWTVYGGGGYWINPGLGNRDYGFSGVALWRQVNDALNLGVELFHQGSPVAGMPDTTGFNVGFTYDFSRNWHLLASAGSGLQNRDTTDRFSWYLALQLTF